MKKKLHILFFLLLLSLVSYGQREAANWYFGDKAGLSFVSGNPSPLIDGEIDSLEGCASISSSEGDLLFYTNGTTVWNSQHQIMTNGEDLAGSDSSTQSAVIVPQPGSGNFYYIFTTDAVNSYVNSQTGGTGLNYSIVNASGLGQVTTKNVNLLPFTSEKITAVTAANGDDIWVITQFQNKFYSYLVTASGVSSPVISTVPHNEPDLLNMRGAMKVSPKGDKLAIAHMEIASVFTLNGRVLLYDFNNTTGAVTNEILLDEDFIYYGVEFSSDSSKLYASGKSIFQQDPNEPRLRSRDYYVFQFDLESSDIPGSKFEAGFIEQSDNTVSDLGGSLQLAVDKKIYFTTPGVQLSVFKTPNLLGEESGFRKQTIPLEGRFCQFGLPPFVQSFFESIFTFEGICFGDITQFTVFDDANVSTIQWDFGDPASGADNFSTDLNPSHFYAEPGSYIVTADVTFTDGRLPKRFIEIVEISAIPDPDEQLELVQCDIDGVDDGIATFNLNEAVDQLNMEGFSVDSNFYKTVQQAENDESPLEPIGYRNEVNGQVIFARVFDDLECADAILEVKLIAASQTYVGNITVPVCGNAVGDQVAVVLEEAAPALIDQFPGNEVTFYETLSNAELELDPVEGEILASINPTTPQVFFRMEFDNDCEAIGGIFFDVAIIPDLSNNEVILCNPEEGVELSLPNVSGDYVWSTGEETETITVFEAGDYDVTVSTGGSCSNTATFTVIDTDPVQIEVQVNDFRQDNSITITANEVAAGALQYSIDGGQNFQNSPVFRPVAPGDYLVVVTDNTCSEASLLVNVRGAPRFFTPNNDGFNEFWHVNQPSRLPGLKVQIFDRFGKQLHAMNSSQRGWDGTYNGQPLPSGAYWYLIEYNNEKFAGHFTLIRRNVR